MMLNLFKYSQLRKIYRLLKIAIFVFISITCFQSFAKIAVNDIINSPTNRAKITIGLIVFPPYVIQSENSTCFGDAITTLKEIFLPYNYDIEFYCSSPSRIYRDFNSGNIDISINVKSTVAIEGNALYSTLPYTNLRVSLFKKLSTKNKNPKTLSAIRKYNYHGMRNKLKEQGFSFLNSNNTREAIAVFMREEEVGLISYAGPFYYYLEELNKTRNIVQFKDNVSERILVDAPTFFTINKQTANSKILKRIIDERQNIHY